MPRNRVLRTAPVRPLLGDMLPADLVGSLAGLSNGAPLVLQPARSVIVRL